MEKSYIIHTLSEDLHGFILRDYNSGSSALSGAGSKLYFLPGAILLL